jgi:hypothetical protein
MADKVDNYTKGLFASMETSGDISGDYLQLEKSTFADLRNRNLVSSDISWEKVKKYPEIYDQVAAIYLQDLMTTHKIPTIQEAALWSFRPGWYTKYKGDINAIPDAAKGSFGKSGKIVMQQRLQAMQAYIDKEKEK